MNIELIEKIKIDEVIIYFENFSSTLINFRKKRTEYSLKKDFF